MHERHESGQRKAITVLRLEPQNLLGVFDAMGSATGRARGACGLPRPCFNTEIASDRQENEIGAVHQPPQTRGFVAGLAKMNAISICMLHALSFPPRQHSKLGVKVRRVMSGSTKKKKSAATSMLRLG
jgi:hypothetical protein